MRERVDLKSPVREYRSPGSVRGALGNWRPYLDNDECSGYPEAYPEATPRFPWGSPQALRLNAFPRTICQTLC